MQTCQRASSHQHRRDKENWKVQSPANIEIHKRSRFQLNFKVCELVPSLAKICNCTYGFATKLRKHQNSFKLSKISIGTMQTQGNVCSLLLRLFPASLRMLALARTCSEVRKPLTAFRCSRQWVTEIKCRTKPAPLRFYKPCLYFEVSCLLTVTDDVQVIYCMFILLVKYLC